MLQQKFLGTVNFHFVFIRENWETQNDHVLRILYYRIIIQTSLRENVLSSVNIDYVPQDLNSVKLNK